VIFGIPIWTENTEIEIAEVSVRLEHFAGRPCCAKTASAAATSKWMWTGRGIVYASMVSYGVPSFLSVCRSALRLQTVRWRALGDLLDVPGPALRRGPSAGFDWDRARYDLGYSRYRSRPDIRCQRAPQ